MYRAEARIEVWRRDVAEDWITDAYRPGDTIDLPELDGTLRVADVYDRVVF